MELEEHPWQAIDVWRFADHGRDERTLSPYDIPDAVRIYPNDNVWTIEFRYISDHQEPRKHMPSRHGVSLSIGKHSGRLYSVEIERPVDDWRIHRQDIKEAIAAYSRAIHRKAREQKPVEKARIWRQEENLNVAQKIIANQQESTSAASIGVFANAGL